MFTHNQLKRFIGKAQYDKFGSGFVWEIDENGNQTIITEIIPNTTGIEKEAEEFAESINEKLKK